MTNRMSVTAPCLAVMGLAMALTACNQKPTESIRDMMVGRVQPTAQTYWNAVQYISDEKGTHNIVPRNAAEWDRTRKAAEDLSDYGRQLQTRAYSQGRGEDWNQFAQGLVDIGAAAAGTRMPCSMPVHPSTMSVPRVIRCTCPARRRARRRR